MVNISEACYLYASYMPSMCKLLKYGTGECLRLDEPPSFPLCSYIMLSLIGQISDSSALYVTVFYSSPNKQT